MANLKMNNLKLKHNGVMFHQNVDINKSILNYIGIRVLTIEKESKFEEELRDKEACIVVIQGKADVKVGGQVFKNIGKRTKTFDKVSTDSVYVTNGDNYLITTEDKCTVTIGYAKTSRKMNSQLIKAETIEIEDRGKGMNKRKVFNILPDYNTISDKLIIVEVYTDEANWSSYPPHKHDISIPQKETFLEEIYYHEIDKEGGFVFQRVYTDDRTLDETMSIYNRDAVLVPKGYHPVAVPYGYNSYYLNVMAGPEKKWLFTNEKSHEWIIERKDV